MAVGTLTTAANVVAARARIADVDDVEPAFAAPCAAASAVSRAVVENLASCFANSRTSVRTLERDMASGRARASQWGLGLFGSHERRWRRWRRSIVKGVVARCSDA